MKVVNLLKSRLIFNIFYCFGMFVNKISHISRAHISKSKMYFNVKSSTYYFHMKTKTLADFEMCISVPLILATAYSHKLGKYGGESILSS